jgi:hypothetical protein
MEGGKKTGIRESIMDQRISNLKTNPPLSKESGEEKKEVEKGVQDEGEKNPIKKTSKLVMNEVTK